MKTILFSSALLCNITLANPQLSSWFQDKSGQYARIYENTASEMAGTSSTTWSKGQGTQSTPTYADISEVSYSATWVYVRATGLASHIMGPWYLNAAKTLTFPNFPANNAKIYRIPRTSVIPTNKTLTGLGATGIMVNGVSIFDSRDAFSYVNASTTDATPTNSLTGDGVWNRDGYHNESVTFDPALAHQAGSNYHYHAQPIALRYQLGDHVDYNAATNRYTESATAVTTHSPILGWAADGLPIYGPYGYSSPLDPQSGVRRMISGFALRVGLINRTSLPAWAQRIQTVTFKNGPTVSATYLLGHYIEDFDYLGDLGYTLGRHFDLNEQNVRWCITPEFPAGTHAYFTTLNADGTPAYPYTTGRQYFGSPTGGGVSSITETVTISASGGPNKITTPVSTAVQNNHATTTWSAVEGGTYKITATDDFDNWDTLSTTALPTGDDLIITENNVLPAHPKRFYVAQRTALATFDSNGFNYTPAGGGGGGGTSNTATAPGGTITRGNTVTVTITLPTSPPLPPANNLPASITMGGITGSTISRPTQGTAVATFIVPANATTGLKTIVVTFTPNPTYTMTNTVTFQ